jgi:hypothetical protein
MTLNELLTKGNLVTSLVLKDGEKELNKALKVKIMRMRIALNKVRADYDKDVQEFISGVKPSNYDELYNKTDRSNEENELLVKMQDKLNEDFYEYANQRGTEEVTSYSGDDSFTEDEYADILDLNSEKDVTINGNTIKATDFMEAFYTLFVNDGNN